MINLLRTQLICSLLFFPSTLWHTSVHVYACTFFIVRIKVDTTEYLDCGEKAAAWINKYLGRQGLKVGFSAPNLHKRDAITAQKLWEHNAKSGDLVSFFTQYLYLVSILLSKAAILLVNKTLPSMPIWRTVTKLPKWRSCKLLQNCRRGDLVSDYNITKVAIL